MLQNLPLRVIGSVSLWVICHAGGFVSVFLAGTVSGLDSGFNFGAHIPDLRAAGLLVKGDHDSMM